MFDLSKKFYVASTYNVNVECQIWSFWCSLLLSLAYNRHTDKSKKRHTLNELQFKSYKNILSLFEIVGKYIIFNEGSEFLTNIIQTFTSISVVLWLILIPIRYRCIFFIVCCRLLLCNGVLLILFLYLNEDLFFPQLISKEKPMSWKKNISQFFGS